VAAVDCARAAGAQIKNKQPHARHAEQTARNIRAGIHAVGEFLIHSLERNRMCRII
jgi:hypothetical protein